MIRRKPLARAGALARATAVRARRAAPRRAGERLTHGIPYDALRAALHARSGGLCEICGAYRWTDVSHRQPRTFGSDCPCNAMALCRDCHQRRVHGEPGWAREMGWVISRHARAGQQDAPAYLPTRANKGRSGWYRLGCGGSVEEVSAP